MKWVQAAEAVSVVQSGHRVFIHSVAMTPHVLIDALVARSHELQNVEIVHIHTEGDLPYCKPEYADAFYPNSFFYRKQHETGACRRNRRLCACFF